MIIQISGLQTKSCSQTKNCLSSSFPGFIDCFVSEFLLSFILVEGSMQAFR
jgi:hypothetical protein